MFVLLEPVIVFSPLCDEVSVSVVFCELYLSPLLSEQLFTEFESLPEFGSLPAHPTPPW